MEVISRALKLTMRSLVAAKRCEAESMLDFNGLLNCKGLLAADRPGMRGLILLTDGSLFWLIAGILSASLPRDERFSLSSEPVDWLDSRTFIIYGSLRGWNESGRVGWIDGQIDSEKFCVDDHC